MKTKIPLNVKGKAMLAVLIGKEVSKNLLPTVALAAFINKRDGDWASGLMSGLSNVTHPTFSDLAHEACGLIIDVLMAGGLSPSNDGSNAQKENMSVSEEMVASAAIPVICSLVTRDLKKVDHAISNPMMGEEWKKNDAIYSAVHTDKATQSIKLATDELEKMGLINKEDNNDDDDKPAKGELPQDTKEYKKFKGFLDSFK